MSSQLDQAFQRGAGAAHGREFKIGAGELTIPRLNLWKQAEFEARVRKDSPGFSLSKLRNRASLAMAECVEAASSEVRKEGVPERFKNKQERQYWKTQLLMRFMTHWRPYSDTLFEDFMLEHQIFAVRLALRQQYGDIIEVDGEQLNTKSDELLERLYSNLEPAEFEQMFVVAIGLAGDKEGETKPDDVMNSLDELVEQMVDGPLADSEKPEDTSAITQSTSPSSVRRTGSRSKKSGNSTTSSSDTSSEA